MSIRAHFETFESYIPIDLATTSGFFSSMAVMMFFVVIRYFLVSGSFYLVFWKLRRRPNLKPQFPYLHDQTLKNGQIKKEILWSIVSSVVFSFSGFVMGWAWQMGYTQIYLPFAQYGYFYLLLSFVILCVVHEVYFYVTHVLMHKPQVYRLVHAVHHESKKTTPWTSFSFHPLEAIVHAAFLPMMILFLPVHPTVLIAYLTFMTISAVSNHLGVELIPWAWLRRFVISGQHHAIHHHDFRYNFGLYFCFLDRIFKTESLAEEK